MYITKETACADVCRNITVDLRTTLTTYVE